MRNLKDLTLDEQKKRNLILKDLNALASKRDQESLGRKAALMQTYIRLMGITVQDKVQWEIWWNKIYAAKEAQRQAWWTQRAKAKGK